MQFGLSESQQILKSNARKFFAAECPISEVRRIMETDTAHDKKLWQSMAEQRVLGVVFPEDSRRDGTPGSWNWRRSPKKWGGRWCRARFFQGESFRGPRRCMRRALRNIWRRSAERREDGNGRNARIERELGS